jgi:alkylated DNA repair dioxygenase AlkB
MNDNITGFHCIDSFITDADEMTLVAAIQGMPLAPLKMRGQVSERHIASFGLEYDGRRHSLIDAPPLPPALTPLRDRLAEHVGIEAESLRAALVTEYPARAKIGAHVDNRSYGSIICGVSLLGDGLMTLEHDGRRDKLVIRPRSLYVMRSSARWYRHEFIARAHRYSITFRTVASEEAERDIEEDLPF